MPFFTPAMAAKIEANKNNPAQIAFREDTQKIRAFMDSHNRGADRRALPTGAAYVEARRGMESSSVSVFNAYDIRDALKSRGYRFNGSDKSWFKNGMNADAAIAEATFISANVSIQIGGSQIV